MIRVGFVYTLAGLLFAAVAVSELRTAGDPRRRVKALFWGLFSLSFLIGDQIGDLANGLLVLALGLVGGLGRLVRRPAPPPAAAPGGPPLAPAASARTLIAAALVIPVVTLAGSVLLARISLAGRPLVDPAQSAPISLGLGVLAALAFAAFTLRPRPAEPVVEAARLLDAVGWAAILPQTLAALGAVFALAGVGGVVGGLAERWLPLHSALSAVCAYTLGMALFTFLMGNAFAAFPVMMAALGMPVLVRIYGADPAVVGAIGMLSGFCGTLVTPMAANFNLVPAALLELRDRYGVIRVQAPTAAVLLLVNTALLFFMAFGAHHGF